MEIRRSIKKGIVAFILLLTLFAFINVNAEEKKEILDIKTSSNLTGIVYKNHQALIYGKNNNGGDIDVVLENVEKVYIYEGQYAYLTSDKKLHFNHAEYNEVIDFVLYKNVDGTSYIAYLKSDGRLYIRDLQYTNGVDYVYGSEIVYDINISEIKFDEDMGTLFYKTKDNSLYWYYDHQNGKILDNVKTFGVNCALTNNGSLYYLECNYNDDGTFGYLTTNVAKSVSKVSLSHVVNAGNTVVLFYDKLDGKHYYQVPMSAFGDYITKEKEVKFKVKKAVNHYLLTENNEVYSIVDFSSDNYSISPTFIEGGVVDISSGGVFTRDTYMLKESGELYYYGNHQDVELEFIPFFINKKRLNGKIKLFDHIKSISYLTNEKYYNYEIDISPYIMITDDNRILRFSYNDKNQLRDENIGATFIPSQVNDLNTNKETITVSQLKLILGDNLNISVGTKLDDPTIVIPYNANNKEYTLTSSDSSVIRINSDNTLEALKVGKSNVCASLNSNPSIKTCEEVNVAENPTGISFGNEKSIYVKKVDDYNYERVTLEAEIFPSNDLVNHIEWSCDSDNCFIRESGMPDGVVEVSVYEEGTYHVTASIEGVSDTFTITTVNKITDVNVYIDDELYTKEKTVYLSDKSTLKMELAELPTSATVNHYTVTSSNDAVATLDEENGIIHLTGVGDVTITITVNHTVTKSITLHVLENSPIKKGDMDKNGSIEIYDVMELLYIVSGKKDKTGESIKIGDMDDNGDIDIFDVMELLYIYTGKK